MRPTLDPGDFVIATRRASVRRGDVVVVDHPTRPIAVVKRVVGMPGELVRVGEGAVEIDRASLDEPYAHANGRAAEWRLGVGEYLVLGDARAASTDGRSFGPVSRAAIEGVVWLRYWPRVTWLRGR